MKSGFAIAALAAVVAASPAPQLLDMDSLNSAPDVPTQPDVIPVDTDGIESVSLQTSVTITAVVTPGPNNRKRTDPNYSTYYYPALATGYTTDPALAATSTTTAGQACVTAVESGHDCGYIDPGDACAPQPDGYGPVPTPDTASAFLAYAPFHSSALAAPTTVPSVNNTQYTQVFKDLNGAVSANSYIGLYTLKTYDIAGCAAKCDLTPLCTAFNLYAQRDPSLNPSDSSNTSPSIWGNDCPNPASMTSWKCTLFGSNVDSTMATNTGQYKNQFQIVIAASDAYDKTNITTPPECSAPPPAPTQTPRPGGPKNPPKWPWGHPKSCGGRFINSGKYWMGSRFFPGPFNPQVCSDYAILQNQANKDAGKSQCQMFNAFYLHKNQIPFGTYCSLYSQYLDNSWATVNQVRDGDDRYDCKQSWTYTLQ